MKKQLLFSAIIIGMATTISCSKSGQAVSTNGMAELHEFAQRCRIHPETMIDPLCRADSVLYCFDVYSHLFEGHIFKMSKSEKKGYVNISMVTDSESIDTFYAQLTAYKNRTKEVEVIEASDSVAFAHWYHKHLERGDDIYAHLDTKTGNYYGAVLPCNAGRKAVK